MATNFTEVGDILRKACPKVKDFINIQELIPYLGDMSIATVQQIKADLKNSGEVLTCHNFFGHISRQPSCFPKILAALYKTKQFEVYNEIYGEVGSYFAKNPKRLKEVQEMIKKEIAAADNKPVEPFPEPSGDSPVKPDVHPNQPPVGAVNNVPPNYENQNKFDSIDTPGTYSENSLVTSKLMKSLPSIDSNIGVENARTNQPPVRLISVPDNGQRQTPDIPISKLEATVFHKLARALLEKSTCDMSETWWEYLVHNEDIGLSRSDEQTIENDKKPGVKYLDMLNLKGFTRSSLKKLCETHNFVKALEILNQNEVVVSKNPAIVQKQDNNMNKTTDKEVRYKNINIPVSSNNDQPSTIQSPVSGTNKTWLRDSASESSICSKGSLNTEDSLSSSFTDVSIDDTSIKGTQAFQAVGDRENKNSTPSDDQDIALFRNDVVKNLENFDMVNQGDKSLKVLLDNGQLMAPSSCTLQESQNTTSNDQDEAQLCKDIAKNREVRLESFNKIHQGDDSALFENGQSVLESGNFSQEFQNTCKEESFLESTSNIVSMDSNNS